MSKNLEGLQKLLNTLLDQRVKVAERRVAKRYASLLNEVRTETAKIYEQYESASTLTYADMAKFNRLSKFLDRVNDLLDLNYKDLKSVLYDTLEDTYEQGFYRTAWAIETDTLSRLRYMPVTLDTVETMIENPISGLTLSKRLEKNRASIIYSIQQEVTQGLVKGESYRTMVKRLKKSLEGDAVKSMRIVRTEAHRSMETSKHDSAAHANKNGVKMLKEWNSLEDQRVRDAHDILNGEQIPVTENFKSTTGSKGQGPGMMGSARDDINCRCFLTYKVASIERVDAKELENVTFEDWKKERLSL